MPSISLCRLLVVSLAALLPACLALLVPSRSSAADGWEPMRRDEYCRMIAVGGEYQTGAIAPDSEKNVLGLRELTVMFSDSPPYPGDQKQSCDPYGYRTITLRPYTWEQRGRRKVRRRAGPATPVIARSNERVGGLWVVRFNKPISCRTRWGIEVRESAFYGPTPDARTLSFRPRLARYTRDDAVSPSYFRRCRRTWKRMERGDNVQARFARTPEEAGISPDVAAENCRDSASRDVPSMRVRNPRSIRRGATAFTLWINDWFPSAITDDQESCDTVGGRTALIYRYIENDDGRNVRVGPKVVLSDNSNAFIMGWYDVPSWKPYTCEPGRFDRRNPDRGTRQSGFMWVETDHYGGVDSKPVKTDYPDEGIAPGFRPC